MESEFPDGDEEFDLLHEDEYEVLRELEGIQVQKTTPKNIPHTQENNVPQTNNNRNHVEINLSQNNSISSQKEKQLETNRESIFSQCNGTSNKRSIDLISDDITSNFLDPSDFSDLDQFTSPQKKRPCWDQPEEIIKLIKERRKNNYNISSLKNDGCRTIVEEDISKYITKRVPLYNFVAVTRTEDGERFYVKFSDKKRYEPEKCRPTTNSLLLSFNQLKDEAEKILLKQAERASLEVLDSTESKSISCELWVDKYRPKRYLDLLSDENINRAILHWLKLWDKIVFDRDPTVRQKKTTPNVKKNKFKKKGEDVPDYDSKGFPTQRIALLSGPPGLGKTTLAHVAARHTGYNVVELNASDDRGPEAFREALLASTQMRAVIDKEKRPNCLILDEIDGAPAASIELLLKFIHGKLTPKGRNPKVKQKDSDGCRRPIICICNDLYAPSLRPLRSMALIISVPEISPLSLAERLAQITRKEGVRVDMRLLIQLAERTACDVRACLGILQYTGGGANMLQNLALGLKDMRKGLFDSWREMLHVPTNRNGMIPITERVQRTMKLTHQVETDRLSQGVFHNYPVTSKDRINDISKALDWFQFYDLLNRLLMEQQSWILMPYTSSAACAWHLYLANNQIPRITYPTIVFEVNQKLERNKAILMLTKRTCKTDVTTLVTDVLPYLPDLLSPRLRTVNAQLFSPKEKQELERLVNLMLDFGLTFTQERKPGGSYEYNLDPNIWDIGTFPECKVRRQMAYAVKQIVIQELETTRLQRSAIATGGPDNSSTAKPSTSSKNSPAVQPAKQTQDNVPNHLRRLNPMDVRPEVDKKCRNFFQAFQLAGQEKLKKKLEQEKEEGIVNEKDVEAVEMKQAEDKKRNLMRSDVWYEYKEGYSNAVRRTVFMKSLLD